MHILCIVTSCLTSSFSNFCLLRIINSVKQFYEKSPKSCGLEFYLPNYVKLFILHLIIKLFFLFKNNVILVHWHRRKSYRISLTFLNTPQKFSLYIHRMLKLGSFYVYYQYYIQNSSQINILSAMLLKLITLRGNMCIYLIKQNAVIWMPFMSINFYGRMFCNVLF